MVTLEFLKTHALFGGLDQSELEMVRSLLKEETFQKGDIIIREGDLGDRLYFIHRGSVEILKKVVSQKKDVQERLAVLESGDTFGEMELIDVQHRAATVRALEDTETLTLSNRDLYRIEKENLKTFTIIIMNLAREISRRLRRMDAEVASSLFRNDHASGGGI